MSASASASAVVMQDLSAALATRNLQDSIGDSGTNQVFILQSADLVERQAVCGNLVCEAGERPSSVDGSNGGRHCLHSLQLQSCNMCCARECSMQSPIYGHVLCPKRKVCGAARRHVLSRGAECAGWCNTLG